LRYYLAYALGAVVVVPIGALIAKHVTFRIAGFWPRYSTALVSSIVAYLAVNALGLCLRAFGGFPDAFPDHSSARGPQVVIGWGALSCCHITFLKSDAGDRLTPAKAIVVAICQIIGPFVAAVLTLIPFVLVRRALL
jgi:hypothetical protein